MLRGKVRGGDISGGILSILVVMKAMDLRKLTQVLTVDKIEKRSQDGLAHTPAFRSQKVEDDLTIETKRKKILCILYSYFK